MYVGLGEGVTEVENVNVCECESGCESVLLHCLQLVLWCVRNACMHEQKFYVVLHSFIRTVWRLSVGPLQHGCV